ncbi:MAG: amidohydrolase [bacterium]|nr:amidohydrolase [bacterium]
MPNQSRPGAAPPYLTVDADNHYYETRDAFTRHIESRYRDRSVHTTMVEDEEVFLVDETPYRFAPVKFEKTNPPGSLVESLRDPTKRSYSSRFSEDEMLPAFQNRDARLELMDRQGIEAAVLLPSFAVCVEHPLRHDPALSAAVLRAFNRWVEDEWGYAYRDRIFGVPLIGLRDLEAGCAELERVLEAGARMVHLQAGPIDGRSPADPHFDPFWARVNEARIPVAYHIGDSGYNALFGTAWGEEANPPVRAMSAFQWAFMHGDRPIMETLGALTYHNLFGRFPNLQIVSLENGSDWVDYLLKHLDKKKGMGRQGPWPGGYFKGRPSEVLKHHLWLTPYPEDDVRAIIDTLGDDRVLFGSDYPHPEGLAEPNTFVELIEGLSQAATRRVMRDNAARILGLS